MTHLVFLNLHISNKNTHMKNSRIILTVISLFVIIGAMSFTASPKEKSESGIAFHQGLSKFNFC